MKRLFFIAMSGILSLGIFSITACAEPRKHFTHEEDQKLIQLFQEFGDKNWNIIAEHMQNRTTRQCKDRYKNYLDEYIQKTIWTKDEDKLLLEKYNKLGERQSRISKFFKGTNSSQVRNRLIKLKKEEEKSLNKIKSSIILTLYTISKPEFDFKPTSKLDFKSNTEIDYFKFDDFEFNLLNNKINFFEYDHKYDWMKDICFSKDIKEQTEDYKKDQNCEQIANN